MAYREELVERLREHGFWGQLTGDQQKRFQALTDDQARQILVMDDQWEMSEQSAVEMFGLMALVKMTKAFRGALIQSGGADVGKLSSAGRLLAEFFFELQQRGLSPDEIDEELGSFGPLVIAALLAAYKGPSQ